MNGLLARYDRPGPRYTSYPTAAEFHSLGGAAAEVHARALDRAARRAGPLALYLHVPFCEERCLFCGCHTVVTRHRERAAPYLEAIEREIAVQARALEGRRALAQVHWGGGTPTYLSPAQIRRLHAAVREGFPLESDAELSVEADPRATTEEHVDTLGALGFNRLSVGVQDFDPAVQDAVNRRQGFDITRDVIERARAAGFRSVNVDLVYGLPRQTLSGFRETLGRVLELSPGRAAVYGYAHVPWLKPHQRRLDEAALPGASARLELFAAAAEAFTSAGYVAIGMDHFARPDDELSRAALDGTLHRNFMGYTVKAAGDLLACGASAISDVSGGFFQNRRKLIDYERAEGLATERGYLRTPEDEARRFAIASLMCRFRLDFAEWEREHGVRFPGEFSGERAELEAMEADGLVRLSDAALEVTAAGRMFVRNVCMVFDAHSRRGGGSRAPRFSRTI